MAAHAEYAFLGIENPLLDMSAKVEPAFLEKYGLKANDAILAEEKHQPLYKDFIDNHKIMYVAGGATQNSMRGAQYMLPPKSTVFIGCVGDDENAAILQKAAEKDGLLTQYMVDKSTPTGKCAVLITGNHRSMCTDLLAANNYKESHLTSQEIWARIEAAKFFYVGGYFLTVSVPSIMKIAEHAAQHDKPFALNLSAPFIPQFFKDPLNQALEYADFVFGNESEAAAYAAASGWETKDLQQIAVKIAQLPKKTSSRSRLTVITQGAGPTIVACGKIGKAMEIPIIAIKPEQIVDTTGAGDAFVGGFMSQIVQAKDVETAVKAGHYLAHIVIQRDGPTYPEEPHTFSA